jgi:RNA-binding protein
MPTLILTPAERREHRAAAHHLSPVVTIGNDGLTPAVEREVDGALNAHGLIKVKVSSDDRLVREAVFAHLTASLSAAAVQHIGKQLVFWRPIPPKASTDREGRAPGPRTVKVVSFSKTGNHRATVRKVRVMGNERITPGGKIKRRETRAVSPKKTAAE